MHETDLYKGLYFFLFNQITDAIRDLEQGCASLAKDRLCQAQQQAEERYLGASDRTQNMYHGQSG